MRFLFLLIFLIPLTLNAQSAGTITIGERTVNYDSMIESGGSNLYYQDDTLVASEHGSSAFVYENDVAVLEAHDTDGDGSYDTFLTLDASGEMLGVTGSGADRFTRAEPTTLEDLIAQNPDSLSV